MRSQLRLRVLLPVAVLGLLGMGDGAFAMGGPPGGAGAPTTAATTTAPAPPPPPTTTLAGWAAEANKLCAQASKRLLAAGFPTTPEQAIAFMETYLKVYRDFNPALAALGWPEGYRAPVRRLVGLSAQGTENAAAMLEAMRASDQAEVLRLV